MAGHRDNKKFILILGGARSGKSELALNVCESVKSEGPRVYLATAEALDTEMAVRIERHRARRGPLWETVEEPLNVAGRVWEATPGGVLLIDCVTLWLSNLIIHAGVDDTGILEEVKRLAAACLESSSTVVAVSNEVGLGIVADNHLSRRFTDIAGLANQELARSADEVFFTAAGLPFKMK